MEKSNQKARDIVISTLGEYGNMFSETLKMHIANQVAERFVDNGLIETDDEPDFIEQHADEIEKLNKEAELKAKKMQNNPLSELAKNRVNNLGSSLNSSTLTKSDAAFLQERGKLEIDESGVQDNKPLPKKVADIKEKTKGKWLIE